MNSQDLDKKYGYSDAAQLVGLKENYQARLEAASNNLFKDTSFIDYDEIWKEVIAFNTEHYFRNDLYYMVFYCYRKYILKAVDTNPSIQIKNKLLLEYEKSCEDFSYEDTALNVILSELSRKEFDYLMGKYFLFENEDYCDKKIEGRLRRAFTMTKEYSNLLFYGKKPLLDTPAALVAYLGGMSEFFVGQIGEKGSIMPHSDKVNKTMGRPGSVGLRRALPLFIGGFIAAIVALVIWSIS